MKQTFQQILHFQIEISKQKRIYEELKTKLNENQAKFKRYKFAGKCFGLTEILALISTNSLIEIYLHIQINQWEKIYIIILNGFLLEV